ncbi:ABC transporter permease [Pedobacter metabolipauper]|uniref:Putative ABC transport system permease protein n=1 Tax=Pedobacter metabolipauper TaxID=425513 RepID=A0A4R6STM2_9SPHI|nr:ABC transporter permease [Pedobacter metabolipauper]TDQ08358.1 putative ABC transport system permease protein [Pedobacter metabolipauper]
MFKINLLIAFRNIWRNKVTTAIKMIGLIAGLTSAVLLVVYLMFELSYDKHNKNAARVYRIHSVNGADLKENIKLPSGLTDMMISEIPELENGIQLSGYKDQVKVNEETYKEQILRTETSFFDLFTATFIKGNASVALKEPFTAVVSESFAAKAFPKGSAIGQTLQLKWEDSPFRIVGIIKDLPKAAHLHGDVIIRSSFSRKLNWKGYTSVSQYVLLKENTSAESVGKKLAPLYKKYEFPKGVTLKLMPLTDIHLHSHTDSELEPNGDIRYIYIFSAVALFILIIAIVNFVNLTVAASLKRGKEIGIKKVMGASRKQLTLQFLSESYLYFIAAFLMVMIITNDMIPLLGLQIGIPISIKDILSAKTVLISLGIIMVSGFIAGFYPALIISRLMPVQTLKGYGNSTPGKFGFRKILMAFQFSSSALLIICTLIVYSQLKYISNKSLGFDKDQVLITESVNEYGQKFNAFRSELLTHRAIKDVSLSHFNPGVNYGGSSSWTDDVDTAKQHQFDFISVDLNFINTLNVQVVKGRAFSAKYGTDVFNYTEAADKVPYEEYKSVMKQSPIILNEAAVAELNLKNPIDTMLSYGGLQGKVIGVVKDFNGMSLHNKVTPMSLTLTTNPDFGYMFIKLHTTDMSATRAIVNEVWKKHFPDIQPDLKFLDQHLEQLYANEMRMGSVFMYFAGIAIFLSCVGLFGMVYYDLQQRTKEIAVRKILGASVNNLLTLMNNGFIKTVLVANVIIWPVAYLLIRNWLDTFYYRISLSYLPFVLALGICLLLTILTVSLQALKAIKKSPVEALKYE